MANVPSTCQKILVSATVGKHLSELTRVNLNPNHEFISIHDFDSVEQLASEPQVGEEQRLKSITPMRLVHHYMTLKIDDKLDTLFSFLKSHQKHKILVFFSSCKQVRFAFECFKSLKAIQNLYELHGRQKQTKRTAIFFEFKEKKSGCLFATDIASRGIDFPAVDWVI